MDNYDVFLRELKVLHERLDKQDERLDLLLKVVVRIQDNQELQMATVKRTKYDSVIFNLRKRLAQRNHYIKELERELKLTDFDVGQIKKLL